MPIFIGLLVFIIATNLICAANENIIDSKWSLQKR